MTKKKTKKITDYLIGGKDLAGPELIGILI